MTLVSGPHDASGANEPVSDAGGSGHSVFARALLDALRSIPEEAFTSTELFVRMQAQVAGRSGQVPQFRTLGAGDAGEVSKHGDPAGLRNRAARNGHTVPRIPPPRI